jgi:pimeloyl-ACP methyl ester carboxylesterase
MTRKQAGCIVGITLLVTCAAAAAASRVQGGRLQFRIWQALSGKAHGERYLAAGGILLHYGTFGRGPPVLVLHGGLGSAVDMRNQIEALANAHFVIAPDLRGNGRSGDTAAPLSYSGMADDMVNLLDALRFHAVDVVGWSDGGIVGLELAMHHPTRVSKLVVIGANFDPTGLRSQPPPVNLPQRARKVLTLWSTQPHYTEDMLGTIGVPTLVMAGEFDVVRRAHTDALAHAIPDAEEYIIPKADHRAPLTRPEQVNARIIAFLDNATHPGP